MDQSIKNRLVGTAVIFALAVIFLPMILDGSGVRKDRLEVVIPPQPVISANTDITKKIIQMETAAKTLPELEPRFVDEKSAEKPAEKTGIVEAEPQAMQSEPRPESDTKPRAGGNSWVLQVGSFQDRKKALLQRDTLRKSNIAAVFIEQFDVNNKASYRVRLGPFIDRDQTRVAQNKIKAKHNIDGIIMKYER